MDFQLCGRRDISLPLLISDSYFSPDFCLLNYNPAPFIIHTQSILKSQSILSDQGELFFTVDLLTRSRAAWLNRQADHHPEICQRYD
jgi:hypothetical protein